jgi:MFS family permease
VTAALTLLRRERGARRFLLAHTQSSLGTGAAYIALLVLAFDRFRSPWAVTLILLADFMPATLLGPVLGAAVDRFGRRRAAIAADVLRALVFLALALASSFGLILALALLAGVGTALFRPAILAGLPGMVEEENLPAATSLYSAINDLGHTIGPALAALILLLGGAPAAMLVNAVTFALSALALRSVDFGAAIRPEGSGATAPAARPSLLADARDAVGIVLRLRSVRTLMLGSSIAILSAGMANVGELQLAKFTLHAGDAGFSALVALSGAGIVAGSLTATGAGSSRLFKRRYLAGLVTMGAGMLAAGMAPVFALAAAAFAATGAGNGLAAASEQILVQRTAPREALGRVFGVKGTLISGAFGASFLCGGALASLAGTRVLFLVAGAGLIAAWAWVGVALRHEFGAEPAAAAVQAAGAAA